jgi:hypothetical protein
LEIALSSAANSSGVMETPVPKLVIMPTPPAFGSSAARTPGRSPEISNPASSPSPNIPA